MKPIGFKGHELILGAPRDWHVPTQGECIGLPIIRTADSCISVWKPDWIERIKLLFGANLQLEVVQAYTQPPVWISVTDKK